MKRFTNFLTRFHDHSGQSLVQVLVSIAIFGVVISGMMSMFSIQNREIQGMKEKMAVADFQQSLIKSFSDSDLCTKLVTQSSPLTFESNVALPGGANLPTIYIPMSVIPISTADSAPALAESGKPVSAISPNVVASSILNKTFQIADVEGNAIGGVGAYRANFQVHFEQEKLVRTVKPASIKINLKTTGAGTTQTIVACSYTNTEGVSAAKLITTTINDINNGGGAPCHNGCGDLGSMVLFMASCPGRFCRAQGYIGGVIQEWDCSAGFGGPALVLCYK